MQAVLKVVNLGFVSFPFFFSFLGCVNSCEQLLIIREVPGSSNRVRAARQSGHRLLWFLILFFSFAGATRATSSPTSLFFFCCFVFGYWILC